MQAVAETNGVRSDETACQTGSDAGSGSVAAVDADSVQIGQWVTGLTGAPAAPSGVVPSSCEVQMTKKAPEWGESPWAAAWLAML